MSILDQDIKYLPGVGPRRTQILAAELNIRTWGDLLEYYPYKYVDRSKIYSIGELEGTMPFVQIRAKILSFEEFAMGARRKRIVAHVSDGTGVADIVWWNGGKYVYKSYKQGGEYIIFGRPAVYGGRYQFANPDIEKADAADLVVKGMQPYYVTTEKMKKAGLMSRQMERLTQALVGKISAANLPETLPQPVIARLHLIGRTDALRLIHYPQSPRDIQDAQLRLKFEELFYVQLNILRSAACHRRQFRGFVFKRVGEAFNTFYRDCLPFTLTDAQKKVMREIRGDLGSGRQMNRLLQGDVGSGKTLVALMSMLIAIDNGFQACMMAPTEILAAQHYATLKEFLAGTNVSVELLTGSVKGKRREDVLRRLASGTLNILVGTHAIIEEPVTFLRLGIAIIDEQHRFGVAQRAKLWAKNDNPPHILVMTATPIPRTLAMTLYGDLDVSVIDSLPPGRKPVTTVHCFDNRTAALFQRIRRELQLGRQAYAVFPLIKESEKSDLKNLEAGYEMLREAFPEYKVGKVHGQMKSADKDRQMALFANAQTQILVSTTVIEVGVNIPNASVMVIFDAQRFGLSQLHQLRGRVGRGSDQSYCILVTPAELTKETRTRIDIMCETNDGFRIAEADLKLRGPGNLEGTQQSGIAFDLKIANIATDGQLVELARNEAQAVIDADPDCCSTDNQLLWNRLRELQKTNINWGTIS
ncbi:MAG: ATP-dependent DNA helicase RecG [Prevotella sp.]|nr:ATP-dependent DNA helicase RecG [Prevotella sp.]